MELFEVKGSDMALHTLTPNTRLEVTKAIMHYLIKIIGVDVSKNPLKLSAVEQMIEQNARRLTSIEIKKAFDMYVGGSLQGIEPISGLLDSILFNKVIKAYKQQKPNTHEPVKLALSEKEKAENEYLNIILCYDEYLQNNKVEYNYHVVYDSLKEKKLLPKVSKETSNKVLELAKSRLIQESIVNRERKEVLRKIRNTDNEKQWIIDYGKCILLERFFGNLKDKKVHIKEILKP